MCLLINICDTLDDSAAIGVKGSLVRAVRGFIDEKRLELASVRRAAFL